MKNIGIISTGNELLYGTTLDTNSNYISNRLFTTQFNVQFHLAVGDDKDELEKAIRCTIEKTDIIFITGGIGPTDDDNTIEVLQRIYKFSTKIHEHSKKRMHTFFESIGRSVSDDDLKMVAVPDGSVVLENRVGLAPGFIIDTYDTIIIVMPGVPAEMMDMFDSAMDYLIKRFGNLLKENTFIKIIGMKESAINALVNSMNIEFDHITWGITAKEGITTVSFVQKNNKPFEKKKILSESERLFNDNMLFLDSESPEQEIVSLLKTNNLSLAIAESCTGGLISKRITDIPGASLIFLGGVVAYSNDVKVHQIDVSEKSLAEFGAVSEQVAIEMAVGVKNRLGAHIGISTTGIAGPGGGSEYKPVGTVCFGFAFGDEINSFTKLIPGDRKRVTNFSSLYSLEHVRRYLRNI